MLNILVKILLFLAGFSFFYFIKPGPGTGDLKNKTPRVSLLQENTKTENKSSQEESNLNTSKVEVSSQEKLINTKSPRKLSFEEFKSLDVNERFSDFLQIYLDLEPDQISLLLQECDNLGYEEKILLFDKWSKFDPQSTTEFLLNNPKYSDYVFGVFEKWLQKEPYKVLDWFENNLSSFSKYQLECFNIKIVNELLPLNYELAMDKFKNFKLNSADRSDMKKFIALITKERGYEEALNWINQLEIGYSSNEKETAFAEVLSNVEPKVGMELLRNLSKDDFIDSLEKWELNNIKTEDLESTINQILEICNGKNIKTNVMRKQIYSWSFKDPVNAGNWLIQNISELDGLNKFGNIDYPLKHIIFETKGTDVSKRLVELISNEKFRNSIKQDLELNLIKIK